VISGPFFEAVKEICQELNVFPEVVDDNSKEVVPEHTSQRRNKRKADVLGVGETIMDFN
jgi:hypothetical protein